MLLLEYAWKNGRSDEEESIILSRGRIPSLGYFDTTLGSGRAVCVCVGTRRCWRRVTPLLSYYGSSAFSCEAAGCHCSAFEVEEEEWKKRRKRRRKNRLRHHHHPSCAAMGLKKGWSQLGILFAAIASIQLPLPVYHRPLWPWPAGEGSEVGMLP